MANEYKLSYTASEVDAKLGKVNELETSVANLSEQIANIDGLCEPMEDDIPKVFLSGSEFSDMTAEKNEVNMEMDYVSKTQSFHAYILIKWQGASSLDYDKKNFTIKMYSDEARKTKLKKVFKDWGFEKHKYVLKANFVDHSHARNIIGARLWSEVVASRSDYDSLPVELKTSPNNGAIDGFPIKVYINGTYQGIYTWNIGKDDWMWNMDEDNPNHILLCGETNTNGVYFENACNFRALWSGVDEQNWCVEVGTNSDSVKNSLNALITCVKDTDDETFKATIGNHLDVQSAIDYYIQQYVTCGIDNLGKNLLLATYDGTKWYCGSYDMDMSFGNTDKVTYDYACPEQYSERYSLLWERIVNCYSDDIKARYFYLKETVFSFSNIVTKFERFMDLIGLDLYEEDTTIYDIPYYKTNNIKTIRNFMRDRLSYVAQKIPELGGMISCTGVTLDKTEITFNSSEPIQLNAIVTPEDTTETIVWESSDNSIAKVTQGIVTPMSVGECVITATCGNYVAECNVSVQLMNLASQIAWEDGCYISGATGEKGNSANDSVTDFVNLCGAKYIMFGDNGNVHPSTNISARAQYYDSNKNSLGNKNSYDTLYKEDCDVLDGAVYARFTTTTENKIGFDILTDVDLNGHIKLDTSKFVENKTPSADGDVDASGKGYFDELIPVTEGQTITLSVVASLFEVVIQAVRYDKKFALYDESGTYIRTNDGGNGYMSFYKIPEGVAYVKFLAHNPCKDYCYYKILNQSTIENENC